MDYPNFLTKVKKYPLFKLADVFKWFPRADRRAVLNQLYLWSRKRYIERIQKGVYKISDYNLKEPFALAGFLYGPSYVSTESALNVFGIIPDVPFAVTSVSLAKTKIFRSKIYGAFFYHHIKFELFFGFKSITAADAYSYNIAGPEKALFDYFYLKAVKVDNINGFLEEMRLSLPKDFDFKKIKRWAGLVSARNKSFHALLNSFFQRYAR